uniref:Uncharacterized protein n=1 Tax=Haptolina brevifila TaxID=156173 RepID=A0A7S2DUW1_9EUKA|mmetsp:Transcript_43653/g.87373  ORF Transcript_43653/g.87373 Transcript_43653/m.87373 type:complete len:173 (+) Transcript_43653:46-564(+)
MGYQVRGANRVWRVETARPSIELYDADDSDDDNDDNDDVLRTSGAGTPVTPKELVDLDSAASTDSAEASSSSAWERLMTSPTSIFAAPVATALPWDNPRRRLRNSDETCEEESSSHGSHIGPRCVGVQRSSATGSDVRVAAAMVNTVSVVDVPGERRSWHTNNGRPGSGCSR